MSACRATAAQGGQQITACTNFPQNPPRALQDGVGLVGVHTLYSYFWVDLKSFKAENATAFDQFESNWSENLSACCEIAVQGGHQTCAKIKSVPLEPLIKFSRMFGAHLELLLHNTLTNIQTNWTRTDRMQLHFQP